jgi:hypothetical protein
MRDQDDADIADLKKQLRALEVEKAALAIEIADTEGHIAELIAEMNSKTGKGAEIVWLRKWRK